MNMKKNTRNLFLWIIGIIILLLVVLIALYYLWFGKSIQIFKLLVNDAYSKYEEVITGNNLTITDQFYLTSNISIQDNNNSSFSKYTYDVAVGLNTQEKQMYLSGIANSDNKQVISGSLLFDNNTMYIQSSEILDNTLSSTNYEEDMWSSINDLSSISQDDSTYLVKFIKDEFLKNISDNDFTTSNENLTIDNKNLKVKKHSLNLNAERLKTIELAILNKINTDTKAKEILTKITAQEMDDIINTYQNSISTDSFTFNFYTKNLANNLLKVELLENNNPYLEYYFGNKNLILSKELSIFIKDFNKNKIDFTYSIENTASGSLTIDINKVDQNNLEYKIAIAIASQDNTQNISLNSNIKISNSFAKVDIPTNAVDINTLSEEQMNSISLKLISNPFMQDILSEYLGNNIVSQTKKQAFATTSLQALKSAQNKFAELAVKNSTTDNEPMYFASTDKGGQLENDNSNCTLNSKCVLEDVSNLSYDISIKLSNSNNVLYSWDITNGEYRTAKSNQPFPSTSDLDILG